MPKAYGTHDIARICDVSAMTVISWIEKNLIKSFKTPGNHRRVWQDDLVDFLQRQNIPLPPEMSRPAAILVVEDDPDNQRFIQSVLKKAAPGVTVHEAKNGYEAGTKIAELLPSLVILDIFLPGLDGISVCRSIKSSEKLKGTAILAISGNVDKDFIKRVMQAGADSFLPKPFDRKDLLAELDKFSFIPVYPAKE